MQDVLGVRLRRVKHPQRHRDIGRCGAARHQRCAGGKERAQRGVSVDQGTQCRLELRDIDGAVSLQREGPRRRNGRGPERAKLVPSLRSAQMFRACACQTVVGTVRGPSAMARAHGAARYGSRRARSAMPTTVGSSSSRWAGTSRPTGVRSRAASSTSSRECPPSAKKSSSSSISDTPSRSVHAARTSARVVVDGSVTVDPFEIGRVIRSPPRRRECSRRTRGRSARRSRDRGQRRWRRRSRRAAPCWTRRRSPT